MEDNVIVQEQTNLVFAQKLIDKKISVIQTRIDALEQQNKDSLEYAVHEKIDDIERAEVYGNINTTDSYLEKLYKEISIFKKIHPKPFFAKIQFEDSYGDNIYYIGLKNIEDDSTDCLVLDWRTPVASLLYNSSLGKTSYIAPKGEIDVNLKLKRQFRLQPNRITSYIDTNTKIDDSILQEVLSKNTSSHMSNIVETIQEEQNKIIRRDPRETVIINGVAGSGKTSIAMHRIAYILFANKGNIKSENILVISPNKLFGTYIGDVLPELGEEPVSTITSSQMFKIAKLAPKTAGSKAEMVKSQFNSTSRKSEIDIKFSLDFKHKVDEFLKNYDINPYIKQLLINGEQITDTELNSVTYCGKNLDINYRINRAIEMILIKKFPRLSITKRDMLKNKLVAKCKELITPQKVMAEVYKEFNLTPLKDNQLGFEDAPIFAYVKANLNVCPQNYFIKHIFVDEMQDYDPFTISLIKKIYPTAVMTLAGDYNQNITSSQSNLESLKETFPNVNVDKLDVSYRSTKEIIDFAQGVIGGGMGSEHIVRHGDVPIVKKVQQSEDLEKMVYGIAYKYPKDKIAIITKTETEAIELSKVFKDFTLIRDEEDPTLLTSQQIITTIYLSKGLEYDRVIVPNVDNKNYTTDLDKQNLYVASTRALHGLYIAYSNEPAQFIPAKYLNNNTPSLKPTTQNISKNNCDRDILKL